MARLRRRSAFAQEAAFLLLFGLVLAPVIFGWLLTDLAGRQDEIANAGRGEQASGMLDFLAERHLATLLDYAAWDDFYQAAVVAEDKAWYDLNVGVQGVGRVATAVLDPSMQPVLGSWYDEHRPWHGEILLRGGFRELFREVAGPGGLRSATGYMALGDQMAVVGIARITPYDPAQMSASDARRYLVFVQVLDAGWVEILRHSWPDLALAATAPAGPRHAVAGPDGSVVGYVTWEAPQLAGAALRSRIPYIAAGLLLTSAATLGLFLRIRQAARRLMDAKAEARRQADCDPLTGIANRRALAAAAERMLASGQEIHALLVDFDAFKEVNDRLGHRLGDAVLIEMAKRMRRMLPPDVVLARIGGDEFAIVLAAPREVAMELGYDLLVAISVPVELPGQVVAISASVGVAGAEPGIDAGELIRRADVAMYSAKTERSGLTRLYEAALELGRRLERELDDEMREGLPRGEFWVAYQPIHSDLAGGIVAVEALARWSHPERGTISPTVFIPVAERSRFILRLGDFILRTACRRVAEAGEGIALSVNLSPVQLLDDRIVDMVAAALTESGLEPHRLELEVTEGYLIEQEERAVLLLQRLRELGVRISLDDFGCGYASLGYLRKFPLNKVKIDRSFVAPIDHDRKARKILGAMVALCQAFDMSVTAEGVETEAQAGFLRRIGCDRMQGYLFGQPEADLPSLPRPSLRSRIA